MAEEEAARASPPPHLNERRDYSTHYASECSSKGGRRADGALFFPVFDDRGQAMNEARSLRSLLHDFRVSICQSLGKKLE